MSSIKELEALLNIAAGRALLPSELKKAELALGELKNCLLFDELLHDGALA